MERCECYMPEEWYVAVKHAKKKKTTDMIKKKICPVD